MSKGMSTGRVRLAYQFIEAHRHEHPVQMMCRLLEVAPSGYYEWLHHPFPAIEPGIPPGTRWHSRLRCDVVASARPMRHSMDYLYSLYDALISINVPNDKAKAVVDAMERDMSTTIATKADLQLLRTELHQECALIRKDMEMMSMTLTVRLGSMLVVVTGLLFAALKLT